MIDMLKWDKCAICKNLAEPAYQCRMCKARVCGSCFETAITLCANCSRKVGSNARRR